MAASKRRKGPEGELGDSEMKRHDDRDRPSKAQIATMAVAALLTLSIFGYAIHQALQSAEGAAPEARVQETQLLSSGQVQVTVVVENPTETGIDTATVAVDCGGKASPSLDVQNIPPLGARTGFALCPAGSTNITATIDSWLPA